MSDPSHSPTPAGSDSGAPTSRRRGRPPRSDAERAAQREHLVAGAIDAIRADGPDQPLDELAASMGVSKPVLYDVFGGRPGLADAIAVVLEARVEAAILAGFADGRTLDLDSLITALIEELVALIEAEPALYAFVVRTIRGSERRFLDNALVRVLHERIGLLLSGLVDGVPPAEVRLLTDAAYGFVWAAVESWDEHRDTTRDRLVELLSAILRSGLAAAAPAGADEPSGSNEDLG